MIDYYFMIQQNKFGLIYSCIVNDMNFIIFRDLFETFNFSWI